MAKLPTMSYKTPKNPLSVLEWVTIRGEGKLNKKADKYQYVATAVLTEEAAEVERAKLQEFWKENRPAGALAKQEKPLIKPYMVKKLGADGNPELDADGDPIMVQKLDDRGKPLFTIQAKTNTTWPDGKPNLPDVLGGRGQVLNLGEKKIGNGSTGVLHGTIGIYDHDGTSGLSFYLKAVQLAKFVEYSGTEVEADDLGDTEGLDGLEGLEDISGEDGGPTI